MLDTIREALGEREIVCIDNYKLGTVGLLCCGSSFYLYAST